MATITPSPTPGNHLMTQDEVARLLGLRNARTMAAWRLRRCGPPWLKVGKRLVRYEEAAVLAWAARQEA